MCFSHGSSVNYSSINKSKTIKVLPLGDNPPHYDLNADRIRPPLEVVHYMKLLGLTVDSFLQYLLKSTLNLKINVKVAAVMGKFVKTYLLK